MNYISNNRVAVLLVEYAQFLRFMQLSNDWNKCGPKWLRYKVTV